VLLEKDRELAFRRENLGDASVINMDALDFPWERLRALGLWKLAGNLPYNIASPVIWDIVSRCDGWERAVFMFQKEVAERIVSPAGSGKYGALSVWIQSFADPVYEFAVKPGSFYPPPKVDSAVVSFVPLPASAAPRRPLALKRLLTVCFGQRRKQIGGIFRKNNMDLLFPYLEKLGIADSARPEEIRPEQFKILAESLSTGA
ncbi:MAG: 16S rRNA (adenine(1518)-N(6)/adenine(1519)-N(6))-dimethyltransferase, partial [Desulfovibrio sp.]|nr:16S rRNA (adenine(1518)-N(6)/adenine(1519)-N(6))-dimethyltransferase [Desulfovibrio sp.]